MAVTTDRPQPTLPSSGVGTEGFVLRSPKCCGYNEQHIMGDRSLPGL